ncbi:uncharacterized protein ARMOST_06120 [Armillaria ostoyae]|uniref:Uncharacterized protein n=1 Tax=Armillaria ostoyae TaxID=47428 RepID=A0A284R219_ARMOS|nr:uncharacterized protein ARMOST_06120 [Armillaria ostoyae]
MAARMLTATGAIGQHPMTQAVTPAIGEPPATDGCTRIHGPATLLVTKQIMKTTAEELDLIITDNYDDP